MKNKIFIITLSLIVCQSIFGQEQLNIQEAKTQPIPKLPSRFGGENADQSEKNVYEKLEEAQANSIPGGKGVRVTDAELDANKDVPFYNPTIENNKDFIAHGDLDTFGKIIFGIIFLLVIYLTYVIIKPTLSKISIPSNNNPKIIVDTDKILSELEKAQSLRNNGAITELEFENLKKIILG